MSKSRKHKKSNASSGPGKSAGTPRAQTRGPDPARERSAPAAAAPRARATAAAPPRDWRPVLWALGVALAACIVGVGNDFAMDDVHLIADDPRAHSLSSLAAVFSSPYWPAPFNRDLYRPLSTLSFALQWMIGGGSPLAFRLVSYALYASVSVAVLKLAGRLLPATVALGVALLFAAHPVHVEAVAQGVNQSELWVALLALLATVRYVDVRRRGWPTAADWGLFLSILGVGCLLKEHALAIPGLLLAAELTLFGGADAKERARRLAPGFAALALLGAAFLAVRARVLGSFVGSFTAPALVGQGPFGRALTMLQVIPEWLRLLLLPVHLQGDYSPAELNQATSWGFAQTEGLMLLLALGWLGWRFRKESPTVSFGLLWAGAALLPVSNLLVPTGILMSERTLFLPSVGFLLAAGGFAAALPIRPPALEWARAAVVALVVAGVARSGVRERDWRDHLHFWARTTEDAPLSYKAHYAYGQILYGRGDPQNGLREYETAIRIAPREYWIQSELGDVLRISGDCRAALDWYARSLEIQPNQGSVRLSRISCLMQLGRIDEARLEAERAVPSTVRE